MTEDIIREAGRLTAEHPGLTLEGAILALLVAEIRKLTAPAGGPSQ